MEQAEQLASKELAAQRHPGNDFKSFATISVQTKGQAACRITHHDFTMWVALETVFPMLHVPEISQGLQVLIQGRKFSMPRLKREQLVGQDTSVLIFLNAEPRGDAYRLESVNIQIDRQLSPEPAPKVALKVLWR